MTETEQMMHYYRMKNKYPPCRDRETGRDCPDRTVGCHSRCKRYQEYHAEREKLLHERAKEKKKNDGAWEGYTRFQIMAERRRKSKK